MNSDQFIRWYSELSKLKIFWAKPLKNIKLVTFNKEKSLVETEWVVRKHAEKAIIVIARNPNEASEMLRRHGARYLSVTKLVMLPEECMLNSSYGVNARSILYFWDKDSRILEPNNEVRVVALFDWGDVDIEIFKGIHKRSWGFFIPPRKGDHIITLAYLNDAPVGMAYFNKNNFNIDYGIHVIRDLWRKRIGTSILREILNLEKKLGAEYVSVVRWLRSPRISSSDKRAISFYRANNPFLRLNVYRLAT